MNAIKSLYSYMKKKKVSMDEIDYIITEVFNGGENLIQMEIEKEDFIFLMSGIDVDDLTLGIKLIGKNFYITADIDDAHETEGYWGIVQIPPRPKNVVNVAKMALLSSTDENGIGIEELVGLKFFE